MHSLVKKLETDAWDKCTKLEAKKEKSFTKMDVDKWEMDPEVAKNKNIDKKDRKTAYEIMYPKESYDVRKLHDEHQFFTG